MKKKLINPIRILKKPTGLIQFRFYKPETKKTESNTNRKKPKKKTSQIEKTKLNRKNRTKTESNWFEPVLF